MTPCTTKLMTKPTKLACLSVAFTLILATGCTSKTAPTPENYTQTLNAWFLEHSDCLFPDSPHFPFETTDPVKTRQMDSLVTGQLLARTTEPALHESRYTITDVGARYAPRFCYGHRQVTSIDSSTPPAVANGFPETQVTFHYTYMDVPVWAKSAAVEAAFPAMGQAITNGGVATRTLARTMAGWQVPD
jgi:hypothetical protein